MFAGLKKALILSDRLICPVSCHVRKGRIDVLDGPFCIGDDDAFGGLIGRTGQAGQLGFRAPALGEFPLDLRQKLRPTAQRNVNGQGRNDPEEDNSDHVRLPHGNLWKREVFRSLEVSGSRRRSHVCLHQRGEDVRMGHILISPTSLFDAITNVQASAQ